MTVQAILLSLSMFKVVMLLVHPHIGANVSLYTIIYTTYTPIEAEVEQTNLPILLRVRRINTFIDIFFR